MLARRDALPAETRLRAASAAARHALPLFEGAKGAAALYWPVRNELSPLMLAEHLHERGCTLCLPVVSEKDAPLQFRQWAPGDGLHENRYGVDEPSHESPFVAPSVLIVPLTAFDSKGTRLGTGGGYYDRTLRALRAEGPITAIGYAYAFQEIAELPHEAHDEPLDAVVTEERIVSCKKSE